MPSGPGNANNDGEGGGNDGEGGGESRAPIPRPGSMPPPEPENAPRSKETDKDDGPRTSGKPGGNGTANPHGSYKCEICGRRVGGGAAGQFQHCRSPFHLSCWVYHRNYGHRDWPFCQQDGDRWSRMLWHENKTGPSEWPAGQDPRKKKKEWETPPPPIRADPDKKKWNGPGDDPGDGANGPGASSSASSSRHSLLLHMWQMAIREA